MGRTVEWGSFPALLPEMYDVLCISHAAFCQNFVWVGSYCPSSARHEMARLYCFISSDVTAATWRFLVRFISRSRDFVYHAAALEGSRPEELYWHLARPSLAYLQPGCVQC